jgi:stress-induced morphogen
MPAISPELKAVADGVTQGLRRAFPHDTIDIREGYKGRIHVLVVSDRFNGMTERQKQDLFWEILKEESPEEADAVSVAVIYGTDEL